MYSRAVSDRGRAWGGPLHFAACQRVVRAQPVPKAPGFSQHFSIAVLASQLARPPHLQPPRGVRRHGRLPHGTRGCVALSHRPGQGGRDADDQGVPSQSSDPVARFACEAGCHHLPDDQQVLPPDLAAGVLRATGRRAKDKGLSVEASDEDLGLALVRAWAKAIRKADEAAARPRVLVSTDGEAFVFTTDHFEFDAAARTEVEAKLRGVEGVEGPADDEEEREYSVLKEGNAMHRHWDNTVIGRFIVETGRVRLETNSVERAGPSATSRGSGSAARAQKEALRAMGRRAPTCPVRQDASPRRAQQAGA